MILYPPLIADQIPAFGYTDGNDKVTIKVPFSWNPAVPYPTTNSPIYIKLQIKEYFSSKVIATKRKQLTAFTENVSFSVTAKDFKIDTISYYFPSIGAYYKLQIAYDDNDGSELTYSQVGLGRCVSSDTLTLIKNEANVDLSTNEGAPSKNPIKYIGYYKRNQFNEPMYSYRFNFRNSEGTLLETSDTQYWNSQDDQQSSSYYISQPTYTLSRELEAGKKYRMDFIVYTINGYRTTKSVYVEKEGSVTEMGCNIAITAEAKNDYGYIYLTLSTEQSRRIDGKFLLERTDEKNIDTKWDKLCELKIGSPNDLNNWYWKDYSVEPNVNYKYRLRRFRNGKYSVSITTPYVAINSDGIMLSDNAKMLKVIFNAKVSSLKETILESKQDTIGGKYPVFYRNGQVRYREIPISGLISYWSDEKQQFATNSTLGLNTTTKPRTTNLSDYNIRAEKEFREAVLAWLNNGKAKLFRSATEGEFVVRLMNVSLSPEESLGRMLWSFSATAYEMADKDFETMKELKVVNTTRLTISNSTYNASNDTWG